uniref:V-type proton ATPase subunit F n=1 Tax=Kwoniella dejecticola CBS 10117 TaxID=1296121 RepID=A0A1A5ZTT9_9TREE|nr:V-type proton ATPase subunit F [Kwoniella dejecticola CBS 10117]OBR81237.1 V-type proton ATPase subunit F [Kwoniella dejecticola CBS 10117]
MATTTTNPKDRTLLAVIGDEDSVTGLLLAGIGHVDQNQNKNFLIVDAKTQTSVIESAFQDFTERKDVAILLINQHVAEKIRPTVDRYQAAFPALLEIPSKEHPYGKWFTPFPFRIPASLRGGAPQLRIFFGSNSYLTRWDF